MGTFAPRRRVLAAAVLAGLGVALLGITQAHAFSPGAAGGASVHFGLGRPPGSLTLRVTTAQPAKTVSVKLSGAGWIRCRVAGRGAVCPVPDGVQTARIARVDVLATR
jgi:hypothetical protein